MQRLKQLSSLLIMVNYYYFLTLVSFYIIRGNFEEVDLKPIGLIVGLLLAMRNK